MNAPAGQAPVRALKAWRDSQRDAVLRVLQAVSAQWHADWGIDAGDAPDDRPHEASLVRLETALFGDAVHAPTASGTGPVVAQDVARAAWADWNARIAQATGEAPGDLPAAASAPTGAVDWSGALQLGIRWCGTSWPMRVPGTAVVRLLRAAGENASTALPSPKPLARLQDALAPQTVQVHAWLQPVSVSLGDLQALAPGDVLVLPHALDAPAQLTGPAGTPLCAAWLGQRAGRVAVELS